MCSAVTVLETVTSMESGQSTVLPPPGLALNALSITIELNEIHEMTPNAWSLSVTVSYLETLLEVVGEGRDAVARGESRESLRERFRKVLRQLKRFKAENEAEHAAWSLLVASHQSTAILPDWKPAIGRRPAAHPENVFTRNAPTSSDDLLASTWSELYSSSSPYTGRLGDLPAPVPFFSKAVATLDVAIRVGRDGVTAVYAAVMALWSRRHDILKSDAAAKQQPRRRRSLDRLHLALMRFVFGFFGSHKVDARNNP